MPIFLKDVVWLISEKNAADLTQEEKKFMLNNFFLANYNNMIKPYPRYDEIYKKYENERRYLGDDELILRFNEQEYRDLQVWYNLTWIGMKSRQRPKIKELFEKGRDFREEDKIILFDEILDILASIIPMHKKLYDSGQIDLTTTPFYHPILPLVCDNYIAKESSERNRLGCGRQKEVSVMKQ